MMSAGSRPRTSQPRGVCIYYTTPRGCFAANNCKFLHGDAAELTPYDSSKLCRYFISGQSLSLPLNSWPLLTTTPFRLLQAWRQMLVPARASTNIPNHPGH
jgi:hypothetical protein